MNTTINVVGTIATDPRLVTPASGVQLCSFRLASDERRYDREQQAWVEGSTNWFGIVCFRGLAGHAHESFKKGDRVIVTGKLRVRNWEKDDKRGTSVEVEAEAIGHDVRWGVSRFEKQVGAQSSAETNASLTEPTQPNPENNTQVSEHAVVTSTGEASADGFTPSMAA